MDTDNLSKLRDAMRENHARRVGLGGYSADANDITYLYYALTFLLNWIIEKENPAPKKKQAKRRIKK